MASGPITSWQIDGKIMEIVTDFIFGGSKITADGDCSHEIKRRLLLGRKVMTNLDSIFKSRDITLSTKVCTSCKMQGWRKHKLETTLLGEISIISHSKMTPPLWQKVKKN